MTIWMENGEIAEHSFEKTLVATNVGGYEKLIVWIDGTNTELSFHTEHRGEKHYILDSRFGIIGGPINTNAGLSFTREQLFEMASKMKEGAKLKIAACNALYLTKEDLNYSNHDKTVEQKFAEDNNMVKCGPNSFKPKN